MGVTIKSVAGAALYVAEAAETVRQAVVEAVGKGAYLGGAYLGGAYLGGAYLRGAYLGGADLGGAYLRGADLGGAYLRGADLGGAYLRGAYLRGADDPSSPLFLIKLDLWSVLDRAPHEVAGLRAALDAGKVDGSVYEGECACLVGTIANVAEITLEQLEDVTGITRNASRPAEDWFMPIRRGDVPDEAALAVVPMEVAKNEPRDGDWSAGEGVYRATQAIGWIDEWVVSRTALVAALAPAKKSRKRASS